MLPGSAQSGGGSAHCGAERETGSAQSPGDHTALGVRGAASLPPVVDYRYGTWGFLSGATHTQGRTGPPTRATMTGSREEERRKLADIINHWNANRLDLFEISRPTEVGARPGPPGEAADLRALSCGERGRGRGVGDRKNRGGLTPGFQICGKLLRAAWFPRWWVPVRAWAERMPDSIEKSGDLLRRSIHSLNIYSSIKLTFCLVLSQTGNCPLICRI